MKRILVLVSDKSLYMFPYIKNMDIDICNVYRKLSKKALILKRILGRLGLENGRYYEEYIKEISQYEKIIIFDAAFNRRMARYIIRNSPNSTKYIYFWNPVKKENVSIDKYVEMQEYFDIYSYDKENCNQYNLKYNSMVYSKDVVLESNKIIYDVVFLGYAKDRLNYINDIYNSLISKRLVCNFYVVGSQEQNQIFPVMKDKLDYKEYLVLISKTSAILDIVQTEQSGLSLRTLEATFLKKKLITNNKEIIKYDIYNPNNIFVIGVDDISLIRDFLALPYLKVEQKIIDKYDFGEWIRRFH